LSARELSLGQLQWRACSPSDGGQDAFAVASSPGMASNVVNLNRFRKKKQREEKAKQAEINRIKHGRTKAERERERVERERVSRGIEGKRLERGTESVGAPGASPGESDEE